MTSSSRRAQPVNSTSNSKSWASPLSGTGSSTSRASPTSSIWPCPLRMAGCRSTSGVAPGQPVACASPSRPRRIPACARYVPGCVPSSEANYYVVLCLAVGQNFAVLRHIALNLLRMNPLPNAASKLNDSRRVGANAICSRSFLHCHNSCVCPERFGFLLDTFL
jgi:hypothetical protein